MYKKKEEKDDHPCKWDCKLGITLILGFFVSFLYSFTKYSEYYKRVKKYKKGRPGILYFYDYFRFRLTYYWFYILAVAITILIIKGIREILKLI